MIALINSWLFAPRVRSLIERFGIWVVLALAALLRFVNLDQPHRLIFDETWYVKDAMTMNQNGYESKWPADPNETIEAGNWNIFSKDATFVVHPPLGKWIIGLGLHLFGNNSSFGWRFSAAVFGVLLVALTYLIARVLLDSKLWALTAAFFIAVDGHAIVLSRTGILDIFLAVFVAAAFYALLRERMATRAELVGRAAKLEFGVVDQSHPGAGRDFLHLGVVWRRPWLMVMALMLGAACSVKWSGMYVFAFFVGYLVISETILRYQLGERFWFSAGVASQGAANLLLTAPITVAVYLSSYAGWFATDGGWDRHWAEQPGNAATGLWSWVPLPLQSLWHDHVEQYNFSINLHTPHAYASNPLTWLLEIRPTAFWYTYCDTVKTDCPVANGNLMTVLPLGNPYIWFPAFLAALYLLVRFIQKRDQIAGLILLGIGAGYLPWLLYLNRTIFQFYSIIFLPFTIIGLTYVLQLWLRRRGPESKPQTRVMIFGFIIVVAAVSVYFLPLWIGSWMPYWYWKAHMWIPSWI